MTDPKHAAASTSIVDRFMTAVRRREPKHQIDSEEFLLFAWRIIRAAETRAIDDPEMLPQLVALAQRLDEAVNVVVAANAARYAIDPRKGASAAECGRILRASKQAASQRRARGNAVMARRIEAAGAVPLNAKGNPTYSSEVARERAVIHEATEWAVTYLADFRARRAS